MGHDASHFALTPTAVVAPADADEIGRLFAVSAAHGVPMTFRSGGTSLSGQAVTDGILVDTRRHFRDIEILDGGTRVRIGPGATVRQVNARLARLGRKLGPDPASEIACTLGGVVANNSCGMACGTVANTYNTLDSLVLVLPSGTVIDTGAVDADERLRSLEPELYQGLSRLRDRVRGNPASVAVIEQQFSMKNTMGYGLNSLLDHTAPAQILAHLVVGSEGTLAFVASVVMRTVPLLKHAMTGLLVFETLSCGNGFIACPCQTGAGDHRTAGLGVAAGGAGRSGGRREPATDHRGSARRAAGRVPGRFRRSGGRAQRRCSSRAAVAAGHRTGGAHRRSAGTGAVVAHPQGPVRHRRRGPAVRDHGVAGGHRRSGARAAGDLRAADRTLRQARLLRTA